MGAFFVSLVGSLCYCRFMGNDFETLLTTLPTVDVCPDMLIAHASTESMLHTLPVIDVSPDMSRAHALALALGVAVQCDTSAKTVSLRSAR